MIMQEKTGDPSKNILIVDTDSQSSKTLESWFTGAGYQVCVAARVLDADSLARTHKYRLILVDWCLDTEDGGLEALWLLKPLVNGTKIAMMGENITSQQRQAAAAKGVRDWITKPFNPSTPKELEAVLKSAAPGARAPRTFSPLRWVKERVHGAASRG